MTESSFGSLWWHPFSITFRGAPVEESLADSDISGFGISEVDETHTGTLLGVLPESRCFEALLANGHVVHGKVDDDVHDIGTFKHHWENEEASLTFRVARAPRCSRYILTGAESLLGKEVGEPTSSEHNQ